MNKHLMAAAAVALSIGVLLASSPANAWTCTAKDARGNVFTVFGLIKASAEARALARCQIMSAATSSGTCVVVDCDP